MGTKPKTKAKTRAKPPAEIERRGRGRPSGYRPEFAEFARHRCEQGATDFEVARDIGINVATLYRWRHDHPEFCEALKAGKHPLDERVVRSLAHRALGYTFESEEIHVIEGKVVRVPIVKHMPPDPTSMIFWLKNRRPKEWRDRQENVTYDVHMSLAELVNLSMRPDLPEPKVIEHEDPETEK